MPRGLPPPTCRICDVDVAALQRNAHAYRYDIYSRSPSSNLRLLLVLCERCWASVERAVNEARVLGHP
jgi:hypothetical protein